jgi:hypothetical protein
METSSSTRNRSGNSSKRHRYGSSAGKDFSITLDGGKEGIYRVDGTIAKSGEDATHLEFVVDIKTLSCLKESTWDRGSNSDEPFILAALNPFPGEQQRHRTDPFVDVDKDETSAMHHRFYAVRVPKGSGLLNLALSTMESDDEIAKARDESLNTFAEHLEESTKAPQRKFLEAFTTSLASQWKLADIEVVAWSRNGRVRQGRVLTQAPNRWIKLKEFATFPLDVTAARDIRVH